MILSATVGLHLIALGSWQTDLGRSIGRDDNVPFKAVALAFPVAFDAT